MMAYIGLGLALLFAVVWLVGTYRSRCLRDPLDEQKPKRCSANSGTFVGYRCDLEKGHALPHEAVISRSVNAYGTEVRRSTVTWPARRLDDLEPLDGDPLDEGWGKL